jgi:hypothetical protein
MTDGSSSDLSPAPLPVRRVSPDKAPTNALENTRKALASNWRQLHVRCRRQGLEARTLRPSPHPAARPDRHPASSYPFRQSTGLIRNSSSLAARRPPADRLMMLVMGIAMTNPDTACEPIGAQLENMREPTPAPRVPMGKIPGRRGGLGLALRALGEANKSR